MLALQGSKIRAKKLNFIILLLTKNSQDEN